jgi:hypothetical protein
MTSLNHHRYRLSLHQTRLRDISLVFIPPFLPLALLPFLPWLARPHLQHPFNFMDFRNLINWDYRPQINLFYFNFFSFYSSLKNIFCFFENNLISLNSIGFLYFWISTIKLWVREFLRPQNEEWRPLLGHSVNFRSRTRVEWWLWTWWDVYKTI